MNRRDRRFVFISFEDLKKIKFRKLQQVADKVYIFLDEKESNIPVHLVIQMQDLGNAVKWIPVENYNSIDLRMYLSFLLGRLNEIADENIEFAILSDEKEYDTLIDYINTLGRNCIRVKSKSDKADHEVLDEFDEKINSIINDVEENTFEKEETKEPLQKQPVSIENIIVNKSEFELDNIPIESTDVDGIIENTAKETVKRLIRSGNRPSELNLLKSYILLHNHDEPIHDNIDEIIQRLQLNNEIQINEEEIVYNF